MVQKHIQKIKLKALQAGRKKASHNVRELTKDSVNQIQELSQIVNILAQNVKEALERMHKAAKLGNQAKPVAQKSSIRKHTK